MLHPWRSIWSRPANASMLRFSPRTTLKAVLAPGQIFFSTFNNLESGESVSGHMGCGICVSFACRTRGEKFARKSARGTTRPVARTAAPLPIRLRRLRIGLVLPCPARPLPAGPGAPPLALPLSLLPEVACYVGIQRWLWVSFGVDRQGVRKLKGVWRLHCSLSKGNQSFLDSEANPLPCTPVPWQCRGKASCRWSGRSAVLQPISKCVCCFRAILFRLPTICKPRTAHMGGA